MQLGRTYLVLAGARLSQFIIQFHERLKGTANNHNYIYIYTDIWYSNRSRSNKKNSLYILCRLKTTWMPKQLDRTHKWHLAYKDWKSNCSTVGYVPVWVRSAVHLWLKNGTTQSWKQCARPKLGCGYAHTRQTHTHTYYTRTHILHTPPVDPWSVCCQVVSWKKHIMRWTTSLIKDNLNLVLNKMHWKPVIHHHEKFWGTSRDFHAAREALQTPYFDVLYCPVCILVLCLASILQTAISFFFFSNFFF